MPKPKSSGRIFPGAFSDVAATAGLTQPIVAGSPLRSRYIVEAMGSGVAFLDFDNDGWLDVFLVNGTRLDGTVAPKSLLYRNNRNGTFADVSARSGITQSGWGQGVAVADYDGDGYVDLFVTYWGRNVLYRNTGAGSFVDVTASAGLAHTGTRWGSGASFFDFDRDGDLDLFVANYLDFDLKTAPAPGRDSRCAWLGVPVFCGPRGLPFARNYLYRNEGGGRFVDVSEASGLGMPMKTYALGVLAADLDGDAWPDLYIAGDSTRSLYYRNNTDGTFTERATFTGLAYDENGLEQAGMGLALGDYDGDGLLDIVKTNFADDYPNLYRNLGPKLGYTDRALHAGLGINPQYVLWGALFADFDNDSWPDLFFSAGHIFNEVDALKTPQRYRNPRLLYWNLGDGKFEQITTVPGIHSSRGAAAGDFDNDGDLDILVMNRNEPPSLLRNDNRSGHRWLMVNAPTGSTVRVKAAGRTMVNVALSQSSYYSANDPRVHFGLGRAGEAEEMSVTWPDGAMQTWRNVKAGQVFNAVRERAR